MGEPGSDDPVSRAAGRVPDMVGSPDWSQRSSVQQSGEGKQLELGADSTWERLWQLSLSNGRTQMSFVPGLSTLPSFPKAAHPSSSSVRRFKTKIRMMVFFFNPLLLSTIHFIGNDARALAGC